MAQLAVWSFPIQDDPGSNPVTGNFYWPIIYCKLFVGRKDKDEEKEAENRPFLKTFWLMQFRKVVNAFSYIPFALNERRRSRIYLILKTSKVNENEETKAHISWEQRDQMLE